MSRRQLPLNLKIRDLESLVTVHRENDNGRRGKRQCWSFKIFVFHSNTLHATATGTALEQQSTDNQPQDARRKLKSIQVNCAHTTASNHTIGASQVRLSHFSLTKWKSYMLVKKVRWAALSLRSWVSYSGRNTFWWWGDTSRWCLYDSISIFNFHNGHPFVVGSSPRVSSLSTFCSVVDNFKNCAFDDAGPQFCAVGP